VDLIKRFGTVEQALDRAAEVEKNLTASRSKTTATTSSSANAW